MDDLKEVSLDDDFDLESFHADSAVQEALSKGTDLRLYASEVESALRRQRRDDRLGRCGSAGVHGRARPESVRDAPRAERTSRDVTVSTFRRLSTKEKRRSHRLHRHSPSRG